MLPNAAPIQSTPNPIKPQSNQPAAQSNCASRSTAQGRTVRNRASACCGSSPASTINRNAIMPDRPHPPKQWTKTRPPFAKTPAASLATCGHLARTLASGAPKSSTGKWCQITPVLRKSAPRSVAFMRSSSAWVVIVKTRSAPQVSTIERSFSYDPDRPGIGDKATCPPASGTGKISNDLPVI